MFSETHDIRQWMAREDENNSGAIPASEKRDQIELPKEKEDNGKLLTKKSADISDNLP